VTKPRARRAGFTLLELMIVVFMIGVLCAIAGTAWMRYVKRARTTEAVGHLQKMWAGAMAYYEADHAGSNGVITNKQFPGDCVNKDILVEADCCLGPAGRCQGNDPIYQADPWKTIQFNISDAHLYVPHYSTCPAAPIPRTLVLEVWGDLDCDLTYAKFIRRAAVGASGDVEGYLTPAVINETE
jgi:prepilin-type N-terminal cleavage/methylation domain-containing protein